MTDAALASDYTAYIGRSRQEADHIDINRARAMHETLGAQGPAPSEGTALMPLGHWMYFWDAKPPRDLAPDGHPHRGDFLPPIPLPRRMWAGSRVQFIAQLPIGTQAWRKSTIANIQVKSGGSGRLCVVTVRHDIGTGEQTAIIDEQDIIYREPVPIRQAAAAPADTPRAAQVKHVMKADTVLLFRYSALTFNGHRIHYDRDYAVREEQYGGLVVHGPLLATLMVRAACEARPGATIRTFGFRARSPIFDVDTFEVCATPSAASPGTIETWIANHRGAVAFDGSATFA
jgi:3-methylfumaryl-CoA hydratase